MGPIVADISSICPNIPSALRVYYKRGCHGLMGRLNGTYYTVGTTSLHIITSRINCVVGVWCWWGRNLRISIKSPQIIDVGGSEGPMMYWNGWSTHLVVWDRRAKRIAWCVEEWGRRKMFARPKVVSQCRLIFTTKVRVLNLVSRWPGLCARKSSVVSRIRLQGRPFSLLFSG
jgi:hypothetical protein